MITLFDLFKESKEEILISEIEILFSEDSKEGKIITEYYLEYHK